jgi:hypothetical protein
MGTHFRNSLSLLLLCVVAQPRFPMQSVPSIPAGFGAVQGRVLDELGKPLPGARVYADPVGDAAISKLRFVTTGKEGDFILEEVTPGMNVICAAKEEAFYPDTGAAALVTDPAALPRVRVEEGKLTPSVTVRVTKGGRLTGSILDSVDGQPVKDSRIHLSRGDDPRLDISTGPDEQARFEFVLPSKPFRLTVEAKGYKPWRTDGLLTLKPEETRTLSIRLAPAK